MQLHPSCRKILNYILKYLFLMCFLYFIKCTLPYMGEGEEGRSLFKYYKRESQLKNGSETLP